MLKSFTCVNKIVRGGDKLLNRCFPTNLSTCERGKEKETKQNCTVTTNHDPIILKKTKEKY